MEVEEDDDVETTWSDGGFADDLSDESEDAVKEGSRGTGARWQKWEDCRTASSEENDQDDDDDDDEDDEEKKKAPSEQQQQPAYEWGAGGHSGWGTNDPGAWGNPAKTETPTASATPNTAIPTSFVPNTLGDTCVTSRAMPLLQECIPGLEGGERPAPVKLAANLWLTPARLDPGTPENFLPREWVKGAVVGRLFEGTQVEFKLGRSDLANRLSDDIERYGNAFINTRGGVLIYGVSDDGVVDGVRVTRKDRDRMCNRLGNLLNKFSPSVPPSCFRLFFFPVVGPRKATAATGARAKEMAKGATETLGGGLRVQVTFRRPKLNDSDEWVIVFAMLYHRTQSSRFVSFRGNLSLALQRVNSCTQFVSMRMLSNAEETAAPQPGSEEHARITKNEAEALAREQTEKRQSGGSNGDDPPSKEGSGSSATGGPELLKRKKEALMKVRSKLPAFKERDAIKRAISENRVVIISGQTGSGKSTQVPQIIAEGYDFTSPTRVLVAQPRRISAVALARRVAAEMGVRVGAEVGYHVGRLAQFDDSSRIVFVTYGMLKLYLGDSRRISLFSHIVLDEVHERQIDTDICLSLLMTFAAQRPRIRLVIMSATIDVTGFTRYCGRFALMQNTQSGIHQMPPPRADRDGGDDRGDGENSRESACCGSAWLAHTVQLDGRLFPVRQFFLDDVVPPEVLESMKDDFDVEKPKLTEAVKGVIVGIIERICDALVAGGGDGPSDGSGNGFDRSRQSVLVFLPGISSILSVFDMLGFSRVSHLLFVSTMHSSCSIEEQKRLLEPPEVGRLKVILATNIAESSLTLPDAAVVIDSCLCRQAAWDKTTRIQALRDTWISRESSVQRMGRTGRVQAGEAYSLVPRRFFEKSMVEKCVPEIRRFPLEESILRVVGSPLQGVEETLARCIDPPDAGDVRAALQNMVDIGVVERRPDPESGNTRVLTELTPLGLLLSRLPVPWQSGMFLVQCYAFGLLRDGIALAALISREFPLRRMNLTPLRLHEAMVRFSGGFRCDIVSGLNAYHWWTEERERINIGGIACCSMAGSAVVEAGQPPTRASVAEFRWCEMNGLNLYALREIDDLVYQLRVCLAECGLCRLPKKSETARRVMYSREQLQSEFIGEGRGDDNDVGTADGSAKGGAEPPPKTKQTREEFAKSVKLPEATVVRRRGDAELREQEEQYIRVGAEELGDVGDVEMDCEEDEREVLRETTPQNVDQNGGEGNGCPRSHSGQGEQRRFWGELKYRVGRNTDDVLALQLLLAGAYPQNVIEFGGFRRPRSQQQQQQQEWHPPASWGRESVVRVRGLDASDFARFKSTLFDVGLSCGGLVPSSCAGSDVFAFLPDSSVTSRIGTPSRFLIPQNSLSEGVVRMCKLRSIPREQQQQAQSPSRSRFGDRGGMHTTASIVEPTLPCHGIDVSPNLNLGSQFLFQRGRLALFVDRFSLAYPISPPPRGQPAQQTRLGAEEQRRCRFNRVVPTDPAKLNAPVRRHGVAAAVTFQRNPLTGRLSCNARMVSVFPDEARAVCEVVPLVFLRHAILRDGHLSAFFAGCSIDHFVTVPQVDVVRVAELREWIDVCLCKMLRDFAKWPIERGPKDHVVELNEEDIAGHGDSLSFFDGNAARAALLRLVRENGIVVSVDGQTTTRVVQASTRRVFPALAIDSGSSFSGHAKTTSVCSPCNRKDFRFKEEIAEEDEDEQEDDELFDEVDHDEF